MLSCELQEFAMLLPEKAVVSCGSSTGSGVFHPTGLCCACWRCADGDLDLASNSHLGVLGQLDVRLNGTTVRDAAPAALRSEELARRVLTCNGRARNML
mmetsp:Transcript_32549/g.74369  ORF Transcript_32549/g.74369 Transcript_32549/m.74369 type:complete len:99 (+) Transcript_32549:587-883(+)